MLKPTTAAFACLLAVTAHAQLAPDLEAKITTASEKIVHETGLPSATVGIAQGGRIVYTHAFGMARLQPPQPASAATPYPIGSISKQFTATAVLLLQQDGKLKLDDPVAKFFPELTRASEVTLRNLLTHTSGYQDYAPQDYTIPAWKLPGDPLKIVHEFAGKPLDFDPGTQWQYSNTNFVLAALVVQKVSGLPFADFMRERVLQPAGLADVLNLNTDGQKLRVTGYMRTALAPLRPATLEAPGWYFGDGDLAMPVASLLKWDLTIINQSLLTPASYKEFETPFILKDGSDSHYALGVSVGVKDGRRVIAHSGEVGGFVAQNTLFPEQGIAIAVLTNQEASDAAADIARAIAPLLLASARPATEDNTPDTFAPKLKTILTGLQKGRIDRTLFTADCNDYFSHDALADFQSSLSPLGAITGATRERTSLRGGMTYSRYRVAFSGGTAVIVSVYLLPDGRIEQLLVEGKA